MAARTLVAASLFLAASLAASTASAQPAPSGDGTLNGGGPFGNRGDANRGGPFTPGVDGPAGPYTPGTTPGNNGSGGPFTPGVDGPRGPYTPGTIEGLPNNGGPFTNDPSQPGTWNRVKSVGRSAWNGFRNVVYWIYTLGGYASWAKHTVGAVVPHNGMGSNVARHADTNPPRIVEEPTARPSAVDGARRAGTSREGASFVRP